MSRPSVHAPFAISLFATLGSTAAAATLEERLLEQGERLVPDQLVDRSANRLWTLRVDSSVDVDAVGAAGAAIDWAWPEAGVMVVRGPDADLGELLRAVPGVRAVEPATRSEPVPSMGPAYAASVDTSWPWANGPDIYRENGQWPLYAVDAVDPEPALDTVSGWAPGEWKLAYDGQGVTVGSVDTGGPTLWCNPVDVRVELAVPSWGVCALFGAVEEDGLCVAPDAELGEPETLCGVLGDLAFSVSDHDEDTCRLDEVGLADIYNALTGYDYLNYEPIAAWFRPHRLHPDFDWYLPAADASLYPELGAPGGVVPLFGTFEDYQAYVEDRYLSYRLPDGVAVVEQELAFAGVEVALTDAFAEALEAGLVGACATADARLPDPDTLTWEPYSYTLFDAPFDPDGTYVREGWNGVDAAGELRVILDPTVVPVDMFGYPADHHGTTTAGPIAGRYRPDGPYLGALRGVAPGVKFIAYPVDTADFSFTAAWRRAPDDGVQVLNASWLLLFEFQRRAVGTVTDEDLAELTGVALEQAGDALGLDTLLVFAAGNFATPLDDVRHTYGLLTHADVFPHALVVGGTAPRDYHWTEDISAWLPDAPGQPYDAHRRAQNLDRPMIGYADGWINGTAMGGDVDLVAPAGSFYMPPERCGDDPWCWNAGYDDQVWVPDVFDWVDYGVGPHIQEMGTSYAAPYATGVAALAVQAWVERHGSPPNAAQLKSILTTTADEGVGPTWDEVALADLASDTAALYWLRVDKRGPDEWMGAGRLDATGAIERAGR